MEKDLNTWLILAVIYTTQGVVKLNTYSHIKFIIYSLMPSSSMGILRTPAECDQHPVG